MKFATVFGAVAFCVAPVFGSALIPNGTAIHHHFNSTTIRNATATHNYTIVPTGSPSAVPAYLQDETLSSPKLGKFDAKRPRVRQIRHFEA